MFETLLKLALEQVQKRPELVQEWAGKAVAWFLDQKRKRDAEREELERVRKIVRDVRLILRANDDATCTPDYLVKLLGAIRDKVKLDEP